MRGYYIKHQDCKDVYTRHLNKEQLIRLHGDPPVMHMIDTSCLH